MSDEEAHTAYVPAPRCCFFPALFRFLCHKYSHAQSHLDFSVLLVLPGDSCIVHQAAVESGSRWARSLSSQRCSPPRQLWSGAHTLTHMHAYTQAWDYPSIYPPITTYYPIHLSSGSVSSWSCRVASPSHLYEATLQRWGRYDSVIPLPHCTLTDCPISWEGFTGVSCCFIVPVCLL